MSENRFFGDELFSLTDMLLLVLLFSSQSLLLAGVSPVVLSGVVHLGSDQRQGQRCPAERAPHLWSCAVCGAAGNLPLCLL